MVSRFREDSQFALSFTLCNSKEGRTSRRQLITTDRRLEADSDRTGYSGEGAGMVLRVTEISD